MPILNHLVYSVNDPSDGCGCTTVCTGQFVQLNWPQTQGEYRCMVMLGGMYIEMLTWKTYGDYLEVSGWTTVLTEASTTSSGTVIPSSNHPTSLGQDMPIK